MSAQNAATSVSVDAGANHRAINPNIYGVCFAGTADVAALNAPLNRMGGNNMSDYNWQIDALNLDFDWYFESFLQNDPMTPGKAADNFIQNTRAANVGSEPMITIPMLPYIAKLGANATTGSRFAMVLLGRQVRRADGLRPLSTRRGQWHQCRHGTADCQQPDGCLCAKQRDHPAGLVAAFAQHLGDLDDYQRGQVLHSG